MKILTIISSTAAVLWTAVMPTASPAAPAMGKSQMSVGFTPSAEKPHKPRPWTRQDLEAARRLHDRKRERLPRCEQDRLLTETQPCGLSSSQNHEAAFSQP